MSIMDTDVLDLLVHDEDLAELLESSSCPFEFHSGMSCPVVSCGFTSFTTRKSYARHWETKHKLHHVIFYCSIPGCKSTCKRKTDMRFHLRSIHHLSQLSLENHLQLCQHELKPNSNYIDPGSLKFVSRLPVAPTTSTLESAPPQAPETSSASSVSSSTISSSCLPSATSLPSVISSETPSVISSLPPSYVAAPVVSSATLPDFPPVQFSTETASQTEESSPYSLYSVPVEEQKLEQFIFDIDFEIERLIKLKEIANARLNERSELMRERELRRELERENRRLRSEIDSLKRGESERENAYFSRDERLEMVESANGSLSCYRRNSTSLSNRLGKKVVLEPYRIFEE